MENLSTSSLSIELSDCQDHVCMKFLGSIDDREPGKVLDPYFIKVVSDLTKPLVVDFSKLEYMNSSAVRPILRLIKLLNNRAMNSKLLYDEKLSWQQVAFRALGMICKKMDFVDVASI